MTCEVARWEGQAWAYDIVICHQSEADRIPVGEVVACEGTGACGVEMAWPRATIMAEYALHEWDGCEFVERRGWDAG